MTQIALAEALEISPSYLNLIEHNRRTMTSALATKISDLYDLDMEALSGRNEARLRDHLQEVLSDGMFSGLSLGRGVLEELATEEKAFCEAIIALYKAYRKARDELNVMSEFLASDPHFAETSHRLLTNLTTLRSFAEILRDNADLAAERRSEFSSILVEESKKLTNELRGLFDSLSQGRFGPSLETELPGEEVSEALYQGNNYFREIEEWAEDFRDDVLSASTADKLPDSEALACHLRRTFPEMGNLEASSSQKGSKTPPGFGTDPTSSCAKVPESSQRFKLLRRVAELYRTDGFDRLVREGDVSAGPAEDLYRRALTSYFAAAVMMPYEVFRQMARTWRHDLDALQAEFGASYEQVCHRLTTLQRPGSQGVPFHYLRSDIAGNIDKKFSASGLALPRFGGVCPLWNLHSSFMQRGQISMQLAVFPDNRRFIMLARSVQKPKAHYWDPEKLVSIVIGCDASFAHQLVYADGLDRNAAPAVPVGVSCKQCARHGCRHRAYPMHFAEKPAV